MSRSSIAFAIAFVYSVCGCLLAADHFEITESGRTSSEPNNELHTDSNDLADGKTPQYCGLMCVTAAANALEKSIDIRQVVQGKFLNGEFGSSADDLVKCLDEIGLKGLLRYNGTIEKLRSLKQPAILSVRPIGSLKSMHWVTFLGIEGNDVKLYDPPSGMGTLSIAELLAIYRGQYIEVSNGDSPYLSGLQIPITNLTLATIFVISLVLLNRILDGWKLICVGFVLMVLMTQTLPNSLARSPTAVKLVRINFEPRSTANEIDLNNAKSLHASNTAQFVDVRSESAFEHSHIPGAVSIPISSSLTGFKQALSKTDPNKTLVFYCQNENCGWSSIVASYANALGFENSLIFHGGIDAWEL